MLVIDAGAVVELLLGRTAAERIELHVVDHGYEMHAPHLLDVEVLSALRRAASTGRTSPARAGEAVRDLVDLPVERYPHQGLAVRVWELRENFSAYDAAYLALAEMLADEGVPLLTTDARFARASRVHGGAPVLLVDMA